MAKADGYYFNINGFFYGQEGTSTKVKLCTGTEIHKEIKNNKPITQTLYKGIIETDIEFEDVIELASIAYAESSLGNGVEIKEEVYALCNAIVNNKVLNKITGSYYNVALKINAYVATDGNVQYPEIKNNKNNPEKFNKSFRQQAIGGAINALLYKKIILEKQALVGLNLTPFDYSYGAIVWDGNDIKKAKYVISGIIFTSPDHNIYDLPDKKVPGEELYPAKEYNNPRIAKRKWNYAYETTVVYYKKIEIIEKQTYESTLKSSSSTGSTIPSEDNKPLMKTKKYKVVSGTTFMKISKEFKAVIPRPTKQKDEKNEK